MRSTKLGCFISCFWCLWKAVNKEGCMGLVPWRLYLWCKVLEYWMIFSLRTKLSRSWKFQRNWSMPLVFFERSWWTWFNGIYLIRFGFRMWEILIFKWFLPLKIQLNSKNQVLEGKISWECGKTWRLFKKSIHITKQCSHV